MMMTTFKIDFETFFSKKNFTAIVDEPGNRFYQEMMAFYPNAKIILTHRDFDSWHDSVMNTIYHTTYLTKHWLVKNIVAPYSDQVLHTMVFGTFGEADKFRDDKQHAREVYQHWQNDVLATVDQKRLLIFDVKKHGWKELCEFLNIDGKQIPEVSNSTSNSLPRVSSTKNFRNHSYFSHMIETVDPNNRFAYG